MKKRILFLIESLSGGGAEKVLSVIIKYFNYEKYDVTVCPIVDTGVYCDEVKKYTNHYIPIISYHGNFISRFWNRIKYKLIYSILPLKWVYKWFLPQNSDVEIAFCEGFVTKLLSRANSNAKKIAWLHIDLLYYPWTQELGIYKSVKEEYDTYSIYDKIICVSKTVEDSFHKKYGLDAHTYTIYNPINVSDICQQAGGRMVPRGTVVRLISVGRLAYQKGYDRLLKVTKRLHDRGFCISLRILGEGAERSALEYFVETNDMQSYVSMPGFVDNPYQEMAAADIFVCSSRAEGFSLVIAEAMALGIPVISTYCSGPNELLQEGKYGVLVENTEEALYVGIKTVLKDMTKMDNYVGAAREWIQRFVPPIIIKEIERQIDD
jgi:glycosyltransferase involved in cell wall biosynthesis